MAASGRGSLRPYQPSKGQNYVVVGLLIVVVVLSYNYWVASDMKNRQTYEISSLQSSLQKLRQVDGLFKVGDMLTVCGNWNCLHTWNFRSLKRK